MGKKTISAGIFILRKDDKLLICHPTGHVQTLWSIPKGKVEENETEIDAAIRETFEETNIDLKETTNFIIHELDPVNYTNKKKILKPFLFVEKSDSNIDWENIEIKCNSFVSEARGNFLEMDDFKWVSFEEAIEKLHEAQVRCIPIIKQKNFKY